MAGSTTISHSHPNSGLSLDANPDFRHSILSVDKTSHSHWFIVLYV